MRSIGWGCWAATGAVALLLSGCGKKTVKPTPATRPPSISSASRPQPPSGATDNLQLPPKDGKGGYRTINSNLSPIEAAWHLRSALNVAALTCDRTGKQGIAGNYNRLLGRQRKTLADAYRAEGGRFGSVGATDAHITQIYNFFAQPPVQARFCAAAADVSAEAAALPPDGLTAFAPAALERLMKPFTDFYSAYAGYRMELGASAKEDHPQAREAVPVASQPAPAGPPWRIQLGAYSGDRAAHDAWDRIRKRMKRTGDFEPRYEAVQGSPLVRIRVGPLRDRTEAISLCAAAAGAGLDCLPVPPRM
ncbi:SPOR domain-containing protein [Rhizorhabdus argentea]|uniref:SPOR domain-containing protein n=1 Tax=Rhizorhabdus argentea TaxID=1387174 RepID=UPI0030EB9533